MEAETARNVNVKILDRQYTLKAVSAQHEQYIRGAAASLDRMARNYAVEYQNDDKVEALIISALNICIKNLKYQDELKKLQNEADSFERELDSYLKSIDGK